MLGHDGGCAVRLMGCDKMLRLEEGCHPRAVVGDRHRIVAGALAAVETGVEALGNAALAREEAGRDVGESGKARGDGGLGHRLSSYAKPTGGGRSRERTAIAL